jgi:hypothetical protein
MKNTNIVELFLQLSNNRKHQNSDFRWIQNIQSEFFGHNISQSTKIVISDESNDGLPKIQQRVIENISGIHYKNFFVGHVDRGSFPPASHVRSVKNPFFLL